MNCTIVSIYKIMDHILMLLLGICLILHGTSGTHLYSFEIFFHHLCLGILSVLDSVKFNTYLVYCLKFIFLHFIFIFLSFLHKLSKFFSYFKPFGNEPRPWEQ